ncbi:AMP-binding protein [Mycolicibacterium stellerae]|uniref:AMP-binding protein n=1 Tax=Mycolicibacterium stellerae TaxID=2358193 RepID=UPI000F0B3661|nr:AMP-binding protein [Mycolicibacterium stellerae]
MARQSFSRVITGRARDCPDEIVVISDDERLSVTAAELDRQSNRLAREYLARGVGRDDLVAVTLPNCVEFVVACAAIWKAGAIPHPVSPSLPDSERAALERLARPALAVGAPPTDPTIPWVPKGFVAQRSAAQLPDVWASCWKAPTSSGSTGRPKIVKAAAPALTDPGRPVAAFLPQRAVQLVTAPLWHSAAFTYAFRGLLTGHRLVLEDGFDEQRFGELVQRHAVTWTLLSPSQIHRLVRAPRRFDMSSLESVLHMGASCSPADKRELIAWLGAEKVIEVYAGSESNGLTMITGTEWLQRPGSVGRPVGGTRIRVLRGDGSPADIGEIGQVWMRRGENPTYTYVGGRSQRTEDGWDTLGDLGRLDEDGYLTVVDRSDDVIRHEGTAVYPSRVEHALESHPRVRGAVAFGLPDGRGVAAVVEVESDPQGHLAGEVTASTLTRFARRRLTEAEVPSRIDFTRNPLRNSAGKVRRSTFRTPTHSKV